MQSETILVMVTRETGIALGDSPLVLHRSSLPLVILALRLALVELQANLLVAAT